ncbi:MAG TPA: hypothetical protein VFA20_17440 [Myxococcaceae bacterium]|nr:hypothetical protein [Myxococcaceae bacterium]
MPIQGTQFQLPSGVWAVRVDCTGTVTGEDAESWMSQLAPGCPFHGLPKLVITDLLEHVHPSTGSAFIRNRKSDWAQDWIAAVVTSPTVRVTANFVLRAVRNEKHRIFQNEGDATRWLDQHVHEEAP